MLIYLIVNHETGKYYVGQHKGNNPRKYLSQKFYHAQKGVSKNSKLYNSMRKHPNHSVWSIHALRADIQDRAELDQTEREFISFLRSQDPEFGYNICRGGEGRNGPVAIETRVKMSKAIKAALSTPDKRAEMSKTMKRMWLNPQYRANQAKIRKKAWSNPERHIKLSETMKKEWLNPEFRTKQIKGLKRVWSEPSYRNKISEARKKTWRDPAYRSRRKGNSCLSSSLSGIG